MRFHTACAAFVGVCTFMGGCSSKTAPAPLETSTSSVEAAPSETSAATPLPSASGPIADGRSPSVSASALPPAPPKRSSLSDEQIKKLQEELDERRIQMLAELNGNPSSSSIVSPGDSGARPRMIGTKPLREATVEDLKSALDRVGCAASEQSAPAFGTMFDATCDHKSFVVAFVPAGATAPDEKAVTAFEAGASVLRESGVYLAVKPIAEGDKSAADALLAKLTTKRDSLFAKGGAGVGGPNVEGGTVSGAGSIVAGMAAGFRRCYNKGLQENPEMQGTVKVIATIGPGGEVTRATATSKGTLSGTVVSCVQARVASAQFAPPEGGSATITIPVSFMPQP